MNKVLVFDMDGTIANLYGVDNWLGMLRAFNPTPYAIAEPMYDMGKLVGLLNALKNDGWRIAVTSWLSIESNPAYYAGVRMAKINWLDAFAFPYDEVHLVKYGTTKANCTRKLGGYQIRVDDNKKVRDGWTLGDTIDATTNIMNALESLLSA